MRMPGTAALPCSPPPRQPRSLPPAATLSGVPRDFLDFQNEAHGIGWYGIQLGHDSDVVQFFCSCTQHAAFIADQATDPDYYRVQLELLRVCDNSVAKGDEGVGEG